MENNYIKLPNIEYYLFKSSLGMKILIIPNNDATIISYGTYISVGSLDEEDSELGIAHYLEHMMFKGSNKYPGKQLINKLDELGTSYNATTTFESTDYEIHGLPQFHDELLTILLDMYFNPSIPKEEIEVERNIIYEEFNMRTDNKYYKQYINLLKLITTEKNKLYNRPIIGTKDSISKIKLSDLNNFRKKYYDYNKVLITVSGNVNVDKTIKHISKIMSDMINSDITFTKYDHTINTFIEDDNELFFDTKQKITINNRLIYEHVTGEQMNINISFPCWRKFSDNNYFLSILCSILTDGMSGRITNALRERNGISYSQNASIDTYKDFGIFSISMDVGILKVYEAINIVFNELILLIKDGVHEHELNKVKNMNLTGLMIHFQKQMSSFTYFTDRIANSYKIETLDEIVDKFNNTSIDKMNSIIKQIINPKQMFISIVGPQKPKNGKIRKLIFDFYSNIKSI
jgi:predicted Zn-dependent peptidase